jgi:hypothetical protein
MVSPNGGILVALAITTPEKNFSGYGGWNTDV